MEKQKNTMYYPCGGEQWIIGETSRGKIRWCDGRGIVESALDKVRMIEEMGYDNLIQYQIF